jgi:type I restriction enzyme S subunit
MSEWKEYKLGDVLESANTGLDAIKRAPIVAYNTGVKCLRIQDVSQDKKYNDWGFTQVLDNNFNKFKLLKNDIIVARTGATVGVNLIIKSNLNSVFNNGLIRLRVKDDFDSEYISYLLKSSGYWNHINSIAFGTTSQPNIQINQLLDYRIKVPNSKATQMAIAEILSALDDKIELNNKINQELENLAQTLFKQWFIEFEFPNENEEPYKSSGGEMVESELGEIPKGWEVVTIDDVTEIVTKGTTPTTIGGRFTENGINFIKVESLTESGAFIKSKFAHIDDETNLLLKRSVIKKGDVLFSIAGTIGRVAVVTNEILPANTNQAIAIIRPNKISSYFLKILMQSSLIQNDTQSNIVQAVQANLSLSVIKSTKFILPVNNILSMIDIQLNNIYDNINLLTNENETLTKLRDTLLPKLISGELEINEIKN